MYANQDAPGQDVIATERLRLVSLMPEILRPMLAGHYEVAESTAGFALLQGWDWLPQWVAERRLHMMEDDPSQRPWLLKAVVHNKENAMIGYVGCHHRPGDPDLRRYCEYAVEIGYRIAPVYQRQGYAGEAVEALMRWAHVGHGVRSFFVSIRPENAPSLALAKSLGFREIDSRIDAVDGLESVFRADMMECAKSNTEAGAQETS